MDFLWLCLDLLLATYFPTYFANVNNFCKTSAFFGKNNTFTQSNIVSAVLEIFLLFSVFVRLKVTINENINFTDYASGIRLLDCSKLDKNQKNDNDVTIFQHDLIIKFFWRCFVFLSKFSYRSKFHVNIITGSEIITIFYYEGLTRNPEIGNTPVWVLPNIWRLGWVRDTKAGKNVSNKMLLNAAKCQGYSFYCFWLR